MSFGPREAPRLGTERPVRGGPQDLFYATSSTVGMPLMVRGDGVYLWDNKGTRYLDVTSGAFLSNLGQGNDRVLRAMHEQGRRMTYSYVKNTRHEPNARLTDLLSGLAGPGFERVHLSSSGSEAVEMAVKFLRQYAVSTAQGSRDIIVSLLPSYHGATLQTIAIGGDVSTQPVYGPLATFSEKVPAPLTYRATGPEAAAQASVAALESAILRVGPDRVLAFVMEPVGGQASGANVPHPSFVRDVRRVCSRYGVFLVFDEIVSAFRTGRFLAAHHEPDALPDLVVMAKGLGAGYAPIGAVLAPARMVDELAEIDGFNLSHSANANPISCAAATAVLDEVVERDLIGNAERVGRRLRAGLEAIAARSPLVGDVRGRGLLLAIELVADKATQARFGPDHDPADRLRLIGARHGLLLYARRQNGGLFGDWLLITPPLILGDEECDELLDGLDDTLAEAAAALLA
jgi:adenosylmethionine-8-amino-7-oxononanoate aminotransferase